MKKTKAYFLRWCHLMWHTIKLKEYHCAYTEGLSTILFGKIQIWFKASYIGCTCGKSFYGTKKFS